MKKAILVVILLSGCAVAQTLTPELRRAAAAVMIIDGGPPATFRNVAEVQGLSCARQAGSTPDISAAKEHLRIAAAQKGANAIASIVCSEEGVSFRDNCWKSVRCIGDAGIIE
jgi:hypothetical protein